MYLINAIILVAFCTNIVYSENKWKKKDFSHFYKKNMPYSCMSVTTFSLKANFLIQMCFDEQKLIYENRIVEYVQ